MNAVIIAATLVLLYLLYRVFQSDGGTRDTKRESSNLDDWVEPSRKTKAGNYLRDERLPSSVQRSSNNRYRVLALEGSVGEEAGSVALAYSKGNVIWEKTLPRPNNVSVSDEGAVLVENWGPADSRELESDLFVYDKEGELLIKKSYEANAFDSGFGNEGQLAWLTTAHADSDDGHQLFVYDLGEAERLLKTDLPMRGVEQVERSESGLEVKIDGLRCRYDEGEMVESDDFQWAREERRVENATSPGNIAGVIKDRLERADCLSEKQLRDTLAQARSFDGRGSERAWARLWRRKGELHHHLREKETALDHYEKALSLDEKVGVKRKSRRLRKELKE
jgi:tetratricopeptide (TPR) repeat protein